MYGKRLLPQNGAPIRLVVPWKYGFKSIKSIDLIECVEKEPLNTWQEQNPKEYGFYANVNPSVDHPDGVKPKSDSLANLPNKPRCLLMAMKKRSQDFMLVWT